MALPTTITGIATSPACVGPFISSGGNVYFFGQDGTTATTLQAFKATDPTSSFASIATKTGFTTAVQYLSAYQVGDVIHLCVTDGATTSINFKYQTFDMSSDAFVTAETIQSAINSQTSGNANAYVSSLIVRSDGNVVVAYQGPRVANMGNSWSRIVAKRRTGAATWVAADGVTNPTPIDSGGTDDWTGPEVVIGSSDRTHFNWRRLNTAGFRLRALTSANALGTEASSTSNVASDRLSGVFWVSGGTTRVGVGTLVGTTMTLHYYDSGDNAILTGSPIGGSSVTDPIAVFADGTDVYALYRKSTDSDLYVIKSADGAAWGSDASAFVATVGAGVANLSIDGNIFTRGSSVVIPYVVNDNGTLKYNEYVVRTIAGAAFIAAPPLMVTQAVKRAAYW